MGMTMNFRRLPAARLNELESDPELPGSLLTDFEAEADEDGEVLLDIDKMWGGLNYLMTGWADDTTGAGAAILGGEEVGEDLGYGPVRLHSPEAVKEVLEQLNALEESDLIGRWDPADMMEDDIYPNVWDEGDSVLNNELLPAFRRVKAFYAIAARRGEAVLLALL
jgi:hypothetical protein